MVAVLIIGTLVVMAIPTFTGTGRITRNGVCAANLRTSNGAIAQYQALTSIRPLSLADLVSAGYLKSVPAEPHRSYAGCSIVGDEAVADGGHQTYP